MSSSKPTPSPEKNPTDRPRGSPSGDEGAPVGTGTPLKKDPLPPSSGQSGSKKG
ncbi:MAG: hypothetical protein ABW067_11820 [Rhizobacter sp.]